MPTDAKLGWIGTGRMGYAMAERLARAGCELTAWNRTRAKAEPLAAHGAKIAARPALFGQQLAHHLLHVLPRRDHAEHDVAAREFRQPCGDLRAML
ncbi:MAG: NAD(P)-binding domain-containing protein, partial [Burkholderiales bacterium]